MAINWGKCFFDGWKCLKINGYSDDDVDDDNKKHDNSNNHNNNK